MGRPLHYLSILLTLTVLAGFGLFAVDEMDGASSTQAALAAGEDASSGTVSARRQLAEERLAGIESDRSAAAVTEQRREASSSSVREAVDDANDILLSPFEGLVEDSDDVWVRHGVPALLGLVLYGFLLGYGARFAGTRS